MSLFLPIVAATARNIAALKDLVSEHDKNILPIKLDVTDRAADFAAERPHPSGVKHRRNCCVSWRWSVPRLEVGAGGFQRHLEPGSQPVRHQGDPSRAK